MKEAFQTSEGRIETKVINLTSEKTGATEIADESANGGSVIQGVVASPGVVEGSATVVPDPMDLSEVKNNTVLIYPHMSMELTGVFSKIKGIVTDQGGILASAATIAREHGIPAVVGTSAVTELIDDGDTIRVDAIEGRVEILSKADIGRQERSVQPAVAV
jgi:pyruvate,water dikinase